MRARLGILYMASPNCVLNFSPVSATSRERGFFYLLSFIGGGALSKRVVGNTPWGSTLKMRGGNA